MNAILKRENNGSGRHGRRPMSNLFLDGVVGGGTLSVHVAVVQLATQCDPGGS